MSWFTSVVHEEPITKEDSAHISGVSARGRFNAGVLGNEVLDASACAALPSQRLDVACCSH